MPSVSEDRDEIVQLLYRYNHTADNGDDAGWADTFTEDGVFDAAGAVISGREALMKFVATVQGIRHVSANPLIEVKGDTATVSSYFFAFAGKVVAVTGMYQDQVVRTPAGWRFAKRVFTMDPAD
jgi:hypothetical protein